MFSLILIHVVGITAVVKRCSIHFKLPRQPETWGFLVVLDGEGHVEQVVVLAFYEPLDYLPPQRWYDLFMGRSLEDKLRLGRDVDAITGATLSARAATEGVRRMLAYHRVLLNP